MPISYFYHFQDEKPQQIGGEVLLRGYIKDNTTITAVEADANRLTLTLGSAQMHQYLEIEPGPPVTVTYRHFIPRMR